jgi:hypothetical protein
MPYLLKIPFKRCNEKSPPAGFHGFRIYFSSVIFYAFFATVPQKIGLSGIPLRSIPSAYAPGTLRAPPIQRAQEGFRPPGGLCSLSESKCGSHGQVSMDSEFKTDNSLLYKELAKNNKKMSFP